MQSLALMPAASREEVLNLSTLLNTVNQSVNTFTSLGLPVGTWGAVLVYFLDSKLAASTRVDWVREMKELEKFPEYEDLRIFLEDRIRTLDIVAPTADCRQQNESESSVSNGRFSHSGRHSKGAQSYRKLRGVAAHCASRKPSKYPNNRVRSFCSGDHEIAHCQKFGACSLEQRKRHVQEAKLCNNCLNANHFTDVCQSKGRCWTCNGRHHTKLHNQPANAACNTTLSEELPQNHLPVSHAVTHTVAKLTLLQSPKILLSTACIILQAENGQSITVRALLDSGAEESFVTEHVAQALSLGKTEVNTVISGVGGAATIGCRIDCILNSEAYAAALLPCIKKGTHGTPTAFHSVFGWVLMGAPNAREQGESQRVEVHHLTTDSNLTDVVARFWQIGELPAASRFSEQEETCYQHFRTTHARNKEGRFVVRLSFVIQPQLANTRNIAEACLTRMERRLAKSPQLPEAYGEFMLEYRDMHHMEVVSSDQVNSPFSSYLPHHPVVKKDDRNKVRMVFNVSQKNAAGVSLNSFLHTGPKLQEDVLTIITRWSFLPFVFTCDIIKMFRQFLVHPEDVDWQRVVWRSSPTLPIETFRLITVTYGTACAPFLANAYMLQLAEEVQVKCPVAAEIIRKYRYAEDFFTGGDTLEEAIKVRNQLHETLGSAGMAVGKWAANSSELLANLGVREHHFKGTSIEEQDAVSTLGLRWLASEDVFYFKIASFDSSDKITKCSILSEIARLYDPIGWLSPVIIAAKIMLQNLWLQDISWDDPVAENLKKSWLTFKQQLIGLEKLKIPRWIGSYKLSDCQLHCFCDLSERVFAATLYAVLRIENGMSARLLTAKAKVAPIKVISLPKLELCEAHLISKLASHILSKPDRKPTYIHCWSDSRVVLAWLQAHPSRWRPFIGNRVSEIITTLLTAVRRHVSSGDNPADLDTRGIFPTLLCESTLWWQGPDWLRRSPDEWPNATPQTFTTDLEARKANETLSLTTTVTSDWSEWLRKCSSVNKLTRIFAFIARWRTNSKVSVAARRLCLLSAEELATGRTFLFRLVQGEVFQSEIQALTLSKSVANSSSIRYLSPFLDREELLRVGGRLQNSFLSETEKHPIILPSKHHVTRLIIMQVHLSTLYGGPSLLQSHLTRQYWIVRERNSIRGVIRGCVRCAQHSAVTLEQQMGPLPAVKTRPARPFTFTGVDYAGPFFIRYSPGRGQKAYKGYVSIFICMVTRAIHLEIVSDLTSVAFLTAFRRFVARRGLCNVMYSDNRTNFQGAETELRRLFAQTSAMSQEIATQVARDGVHWTFIPPTCSKLWWVVGSKY